MKFLAVAAIIILVLLLAYLFVQIFTKGASSISFKRKSKERWKVREHTYHGKVYVYASHPVKADLLVGPAVDFSAADFDYLIEERRSEARYKVEALNSGRELTA